MKQNSKDPKRFKNISVELTPLGGRYLEQNRAWPTRYELRQQEKANGQVLLQVMRAVEARVIGTIG